MVESSTITINVTSPAPTYSPSISASPNPVSQSWSGNFTVSGTGWPPNVTVTVAMQVDGGSSFTWQFNTNSSGYFSNSWGYPGGGTLDIMIQYAIPGQPLYITASDSMGNVAKADVTITS